MIPIKTVRLFLPALFFIIVLLLVLWPFFHKGFFISDDGEWMVIRLSAFYQSFSDGQIPTRFLDRLNSGYGYPVSNFLYPGFLYIGSLLHVFGFSFVESVKLIFIGSIIGSACFLYGYLRKRFDVWPSLFGAMSFLLAPYLGYDVFTRGSVGEILSLLPVTAFFYSIANGKKWLAPLCVGFLLLSHNSLGYLFIIVMFCYVLFIKSRDVLPYMLLGIGMSAFFWLPAVYERRFVMFDAAVVSDISRYFIHVDSAYLISPLFLMSFILTLCIIKRRRIDIFFIVLFIIMLLFVTPLSTPLWQYRSFAKFFQFPFRFLALGLVSGPWFVALFSEYIWKKKKKMLLVLTIFLALYPVVALYKSIHFVDRPEGYYTTNEGTTTVSDEFLPRWVRKKPSQRSGTRLEVFSGNANIVPLSVSTKRTVATVTSYEDSIIQFNTLYYPGWGATVDDVPVRIDHENTFGVMRIRVPTGIHKLVAEFRETIFRFSADVISVACFLLYCIVVTISLRNISMTKIRKGKHRI